MVPDLSKSPRETKVRQNQAQRSLDSQFLLAGRCFLSSHSPRWPWARLSVCHWRCAPGGILRDIWANPENFSLCHKADQKLFHFLLSDTSTFYIPMCKLISVWQFIPFTILSSFIAFAHSLHLWRLINSKQNCQLPLRA